MPHGIANILGGTNRGAFSKFHLIFVSPGAYKESERSCIVGEVCLKKIEIEIIEVMVKIQW